jgi:arabinofuranan 3-O-arabinosyltransferase
MAVDGDPATAWAVADRFNPIGQRIEVSGDLTNLSLLQSQQSGASRMISSVRLDFDNGSSGVVELDDRSLTGSGQPMDVPAGATFVAITITAVAPRPGATDPGPSAVGFAELGLGAHTEVVSLPGDTTGISPTTPLAIVLTRLRTDPLNRWRSDPEPRTIRAFALASDRDLAATFTLHRNDRASDEVLNRLAGVETATSNRRLTGDPGSTAAHAIDGNPTTAWTSPFSDVVGSTLSIPLVATEATSSLELTQPLDESHSVITRVTVTLGDAVSTVDVPAPDGDGRSTITFPAANAAQMSLAIADIAPRTTVDRRYAETTVLPVAITELATPSIAAPRPAATQAECRSDLVEIDGVPVPISVDLQTISSLLSGDAVDVQPCDSPSIALASGPHRLTTAAGSTTGIDVDRIVLSDARPDGIATAANPPTVSVDRTRTTRTATVTNCPTGCWLILGEGYNDGWKATVADLDLGAPRQISGGFNGWRLPASDAPVTVTMTWTPQRTMWIGMALAALSVVACAVLIWRDKAKTDVRVPAAPVMDWPSVPVGRRRSLIAAGTMVVAAGLVISPTYAVVAAVVGLAVVVLRRTLVAGLAALALIASLAALILRRQIRYRLAANPSWPAAFDDLHRFGLLVVVLLLACTIVDDCPRDQPEQVA